MRLGGCSRERRCFGTGAKLEQHGRQPQELERPFVTGQRRASHPAESTNPNGTFLANRKTAKRAQKTLRFNGTVTQIAGWLGSEIEQKDKKDGKERRHKPAEESR